jgi:filamentous hemagglutinin family protein
MSKFWLCVPSLGVAIGSALTFITNCAVAQVIEDSTLLNNSQVTTHNNLITIKGGTRAGTNLFHSFEQFSISQENIVEFENAVDVQNIISRVTGKSISHIDGILKTQHQANLFLINPNGIIFGANGSLNIGGSFVASTANSLNFADGKTFSATDFLNTPSSLSVSVPIGLQFGATAAPIRNQSQASLNGATNSLGQPVGLQVKPGKTLALLGGDLMMEGGNITSAQGRIELGSVTPHSLVNLQPISQGWVLEYSGLQIFQDMQFMRRNTANAEFSSQIDVGGDGGGNIQIWGRNIELNGRNVRLSTQTLGMQKAGDLTINANKLVVRNGAQIATFTLDQGNGGNLTINASDSVEVIGAFLRPNSNSVEPSALLSATASVGKAGDIKINTQRLLVQDGGRVTTDSFGKFDNGQLILGTGAGGDLIVNASDSVEVVGKAREVSSSLSASTNSSGNAGKLTIITEKLIVQDRAEVAVSSSILRFGGQTLDNSNLGVAGELNISARSVVLDNQGKLLSNSELGQGGNIVIKVQDSLLMRRNSQISSNAGTITAGGDGGNITINVPNGFMIAVPGENSDITANAFSGNGGRVTINAKSIFGFVPRTRADLVRLLETENPEELNPNRLPTNDITAFSQQNPSLSGTVDINTPDVDPSKSLVELPKNPVDASRQIASSCNYSRNTEISSLVVTGRGGITPSPTDTLMDDAVLADWIKLPVDRKNLTNNIQPYIEENTETRPSGDRSGQIVEAQGWVVDGNGNVVLVAQASTLPHSQGLKPAACGVLGSRN